MRIKPQMQIKTPILQAFEVLSLLVLLGQSLSREAGAPAGQMCARVRVRRTKGPPFRAKCD